MTNPITIALGIPVSVEGETIMELSIRRPKVRDLRTLEQVTQGIWPRRRSTGRVPKRISG